MLPFAVPYFLKLLVMSFYMSFDAIALIFMVVPLGRVCRAIK